MNPLDQIDYRQKGTSALLSSDLITWDKISQEPQIKMGYCASFFLYDDQFYMVVPNGYRFKVFKFTSFGTISEKNLLGTMILSKRILKLH